MKKSTQFLTPSIFISFYLFLKHKALVSPRAEVDPSRFLKLGKGTTISSFTKVKANGQLSIGRNVSIATGCFITSESGGVKIGDFCMIGANTCIIGNNYRYSNLDTPICHQDKTSKGIRIGRNVWIGSNVTILDGTIIGNGCIVAANSLVSGTLIENQVVHGNPAKVVFSRR